MKFPLSGWSRDRLRAHHEENPVVRFGAPRGIRSHQGFDLYGEEGQAVHAIKPGRVAFISRLFYKDLWAIYLDLGDGWEHVYGELAPWVPVKIDRIIKAGDVLGKIKSPYPPARKEDGSPYPPMLHFELRRWGAAVDPYALLLKLEG